MSSLRQEGRSFQAFGPASSQEQLCMCWNELPVELRDLTVSDFCETLEDALASDFCETLEDALVQSWFFLIKHALLSLCNIL